MVFTQDRSGRCLACERTELAAVSIRVRCVSAWITFLRTHAPCVAWDMSWATVATCHHAWAERAPRKTPATNRPCVTQSACVHLQATWGSARRAWDWSHWV